VKEKITESVSKAFATEHIPSVLWGLHDIRDLHDAAAASIRMSKLLKHQGSSWSNDKMQPLLPAPINYFSQVGLTLNIKQ
jgi:hypothetical protein